MFFPLNSPQGDGNGAQNFPIRPAYREYLSQNGKDEIAHPFAADLQTPPMTMAPVNLRTPSLGPIFAALPLLALAVWWVSGNLERKFYEGNPIPPRNFAERKPAHLRG